MVDLPDYLSNTALATEPVSREVMEAHQRERVLELVTPVFAKRGYQGTTVDDLLAAGKVGVTNFYALFEGKEDCFLAAFDRVVAEGRERIAVAAPPETPWGERTYRGLRAVLELLVERPLEARLVLIEAQSAGQAARARYNGILDVAIDWLAEGCRAHGGAEALPPGFAQASVAGLAFYLQQCLLDSSPHTLEELLGETAALILEPIAGPGELRRVQKLATAPA